MQELRWKSHERNEHNIDDEANEARMSKTPIQFVYPHWFRCLHRMGCCRYRSLEITDQAQSDLKQVYHVEMLADKYLLKNRVKVEAGPTQSRQIEMSVSADELNRKSLLNSS